MEVIVKHLQPDPKTRVLRYRRIFPKALRPFLAQLIGKPLTELKESLGARDISEPGAMEKYQDACHRYERLVAQAKKRAAGQYDPLNAELIAHLVGNYRTDHLVSEKTTGWEADDKARGELMAQAMERAGYDLSDVPEAVRWSQGRRLAHQTFLDVAKGFRVSRDMDALVSAWRQQAATLAAENGYAVDQASPGFQALCRALNDTAVATHREALLLLDGEDVPIPPVPAVPVQSTKAKPKDRTFQAIILELINKPHGGYSETTKERVRGGLRFLVEAVGDLPPEALTRAKVTDFLDLLAQRPSKLPKEDFWLKLPELASRYADRPKCRA